MRLLVTGGAGFIGTNFVKFCLAHFKKEQEDLKLIVLDKLTYAGNRENLTALEEAGQIEFVEGDIADRDLVNRLLSEHRIQSLVHFAAETHVDRSIDSPDDFLHTNVFGTHNLLACALHYWRALDEGEKDAFRFLHVSTDEVFGSLEPDDDAFSEETPYAPNSPYSASKASSDHLVRAYYHTYQLPVITTNCSNNYGPYQFPEKLIPLITLNALQEKALPIYGNGENVRDWLHVQDHASGILAALLSGKVGEVYLIGGNCEKSNIEVVQAICAILDELKPRKDEQLYKELITFVKDRPGHDWRYAIDCSKIEKELGWKRQYDFETGLRKTVQWYLDNQAWCEGIENKKYQRQRLGLEG